ncbi:MAG: SDR family oxidoreductase [Legionellales bacterium]|nr:SDR family oxidoreductase [Legionellales bacterium]
MKKIAIITGATGGVGREISLFFAKKKYKVVLLGRNKDRLDRLAQTLQIECQLDIHLCPLVFAVDVSNRLEINKAICSILATEGRIDVLINNAGVFKSGTSEISQEALDSMLKANFIGAVNCMQAVAPVMINQKNGVIINLSSRAASSPRANFGGYAATKAALVAYSNALNQQLSIHGIKVAVISPGAIKTSMSSQSGIPDEKKIETLDIVRAIKFIMTLSRGAYINNIIIDCQADVEIAANNQGFFQLPNMDQVKTLDKNEVEHQKIPSML